MADQQVAATQPAATTNGVKSSQSARASILAALESNASEVAAATPADEAGTETKPAPAEQAKPAASDEDAASKAETETEAEPEEAEAKPDEAEAKKPDPETQKRLDMIAKADKRAREKLAAEVAEKRAELERERLLWAPKIEAAKKYEDLKARAKTDPASVMLELGLTEDDFEYTSQQLYRRSKALAADPKNRAAAEQMKWQREIEARATAAEKRAAEVEAQLKAEKQAAANERQVQQYIASVEKAATDDHPLTKQHLAKNPDKTRMRFAQVAEALIERDGEVPDPADVIAAYEKQRRDELEELGVDPATVIKPKAAPVATKPAKTLGADTGSTTPPKQSPKSDKDKRAEVLKLMDSLG